MTEPKTEQIVLNENTFRKKLPFYWWFRGKYLSDMPDSFLPKTDDYLEQIAWSSIKYDHLGGPDTKAVVLKYLKPNFLENPNNAWDMSQHSAPIMQRVFTFESMLNFVTIILHLLLIVPVTFSGVSGGTLNIFRRFMGSSGVKK